MFEIPEIASSGVKPPCPSCKGMGKADSKPCPACNGTGVQVSKHKQEDT